jgi:hypothetical protein
MALQDAATGNSVLAELALAAAAARAIGRRLLLPIAAHLWAARDTYRPEQHYMRGPGPRWREKHGAQSGFRSAR